MQYALSGAPSSDPSWLLIQPLLFLDGLLHGLRRRSFGWRTTLVSQTFQGIEVHPCPDRPRLCGTRSSSVSALSMFVGLIPWMAMSETDCPRRREASWRMGRSSRNSLFRANCCPCIWWGSPSSTRSFSLTILTVAVLRIIMEGSLAGDDLAAFRSCCCCRACSLLEWPISSPQRQSSFRDLMQIDPHHAPRSSSSSVRSST